jgi:hypothetical protein
MTPTRIGLDIAKNVFQAHGVDDNGTVVIRKRLCGCSRSNTASSMRSGCRTQAGVLPRPRSAAPPIFACRLCSSGLPAISAFTTWTRGSRIIGSRNATTRCPVSIGVNAHAAHGASHCGTMIWNDCAVSLRLRRGSGRVPCLLRVRRSPTASRATNSEARSAATRFDGALNAAARNRMRRLVVDRFCISATRVTRLSAGLRRSAGANHQFLGWRFPLLFYGAATEFLARK